MFHHITVLKTEAVDGLNIKEDGIYVDCTLGGAGHSSLIVERLGEQGHLYAFDQDEKALQAAQNRLQFAKEKVTFIKSNFRYLKDELARRGVTHVDGVLFDLGVSSPQLDEAERGFSYHQDAALDMRMDQTAELTAYEVVNEWSFEDLVFIISKYGEERFAKQIARKIEVKRKQQPIATTGELVDLIKEAIPAPARRKGGHPAKRTFQAIRIAVNDELGAFEVALREAISLLNKGGRISVITFHSLEDRLCKDIFKEYSKTPDLPPGLPVIPKEFEPVLSLVTRKPLVPTEEELASNHRSRSAKLRVAQKNSY